MRIKKVAIIGAGPSGLVSLNEFLHTSNDGTSKITSYNSSTNSERPSTPAFEDIVVFERGEDIGGTWKYSSVADPQFPRNTRDYSKPDAIRARIEPPSEELLNNSSNEDPYIRSFVDDAVKNDELWDKSGIYDHLFTNVPEDLMKFSSAQDITIDETGPGVNPYYPFITHQQVLEHLRKFSDVNDLRPYIRFNSSVERLYKRGEEWVVVIMQVDRKTGTEKWYSETFDAVMLANGRFNVPYIPKIPNLEIFRGKSNVENAILHTKSFRNAEMFKDKKVLLVGSSISAVDILQYLIPQCREVWMSTNTKSVKAPIIDDGKPLTTQWIHDIVNDTNAGYSKCSRIKRILKDGVGVQFEDDTVINDFDSIIFATGYHLSYPFLEENYKGEYIQPLPGKQANESCAMVQFDKVYMYTFSVADPTLAFSGIAHNPLLLRTSELNAAAAAGVWSGYKKLPLIEERRKWCAEKREHLESGSQVIPDDQLADFFDELHPFLPKGRVNIAPSIDLKYIEESRVVLKKLFYEISSCTDA